LYTSCTQSVLGARLPARGREGSRLAEPVKATLATLGACSGLDRTRLASRLVTIWPESCLGKQGKLGRHQRASQVDLAPFDHVLANVPYHSVCGVNRLDPGVPGQLVPAIHPGEPSEVLDAGEERMVVNNVALLVLQGSHPTYAFAVLVPPDPVEYPVGLADKHPETLVSGFKMPEVTDSKVYTIPLPVAQERQPGVSEGLTLHRCCRRRRRRGDGAPRWAIATSVSWSCHPLRASAVGWQALRTRSGDIDPTWSKPNTSAPRGNKPC
jgi:hypothetical protein